MKSLYKITTLFIFVIFWSCQSDQGRIQHNRPEDPWVFRSVLDLQPRMITIALSDQMYVAYSTEDCSLSKVWKGGVIKEGAVFNQAHGPQPITFGSSYTVNKFSNPWSIITSEGEELECKTQYLGHSFINDQVQLKYRLTANNIEIELFEKIEYALEDEMPVLQREFVIAKASEGHKAQLKGNYSSIVVKQSINTNADLAITNTQEVTYEDRSLLNLDFSLTLNQKGNTTLSAQFLQEPTINNPNDELLRYAQNNMASAGELLIEGSDCATCHNRDVKTVGPSYVDISLKYENKDIIVNQLADKVINGGSGIWGNTAMTAHSDLSTNDARSMVDYILSLTEDQQSNEIVTIQNQVPFPNQEVDDIDVLPGIITKIYTIAGETTVAKLESRNDILFAGIMGNFDNIYGTKFKELKDNFGLLAEGYILADEDGEYLFELSSDDGSLLFIDDTMIVDNNGYHGTEKVLGLVPLIKGYHKIKLFFYQGGGGNFLSLAWKTPSSDALEVIPEQFYFHSAQAANYIDGHTLPMADATAIPGDIDPLIAVHPSFTLSQARPDNFEPMVGGMDFLSDGRLVVSTWDPDGSVFIIDNAQSGDPSSMSFKRIAHGLAEPLGVKVVNDTIYVMQKQELTQLIDDNGDEIIDQYNTVTNRWGVSNNFHEFAFGLEYKDGSFYASLSTDVEPGGASSKNQPKDRGSIIKIDKKTGNVDFVAKGFRTPNGLSFDQEGRLFMADNQGDWLPASKINHVIQGEFYGHRSVDFDAWKNRIEKLPVVWLPQDEIGNSPSTPVTLNIGPYKDQMIHGEVTHGGIKRVFVEEVNGQLQGAVFRFSQGLEAGVNRLKWGPDGNLYIGGVGNPGNWSHNGKNWFGLQKLSYNEKTTFEMLSINSKANGFVINFTAPLASDVGNDLNGYQLKQWRYLPTSNYGGPKIDEIDLQVQSATVSSNRMSVFLEVNGLKKEHLVYFRVVGLTNQSNESLWSTESWYTLNNISLERGKL